ncbi:MAG TPA: DUF1254 domain-containing protein [Rhizomicrobium sp.]|jgi:uncharacterized membrane protein|nr:DUF1254 domain-containing protein [Rhizomicrobium sp.]
MKELRAWLPWVAIAVAVAAIVHLATLYAVPGFVMSRAFAIMGAPNAMHHGKRVDEHSHAVVRPSPDLLYSACPFDLSAGPLRVRSPVVPHTYWSVSGFDDATNNFFAMNDNGVQGVVDFLIVQQGTKPNTEGFKTIISPTRKGIILFRTLINGEKNFALFDALRRQATCATFHALPSDVSSGAGK